jgi:hypothetical protein
MNDNASPDPRVIDVAYYYPEPYWEIQEVDALKTLLLFFDRIAILLPRYMRGRATEADPVLAAPLYQAGLLEILEPEDFLDQEVVDGLGEALLALLRGGAFDDLDRSEFFQPISRSRLGWDADIHLASDLVNELLGHGLAEKPRPSDLAVPLHPAVRTTILILLSQLTKGAGRRRGIELHPATSRPDVVSALVRTLSLPSMPSAGNIVALDAEAVALDLSSVPLDEILAFRAEQGEAFRNYARDVRETVAILSSVDAIERDRLLRDRRGELSDRAAELRRSARAAWRKSLVSVALGGAGAGWYLKTGDPLSALFAATSGLLGTESPPRATAYTYLITAQASLPRTTGRRCE